jgi:regulatory protein
MALKGFDEHAIATVIARLFSQGFLDDRKLAASLKRYAGETRHLGAGGTRRFLRERGIPGEIIDETLADIDEADLARKMIEKKMTALRQYPQERILRRLYGLLSRRGYSAETIRKALSTLAHTEDPQ